MDVVIVPHPKGFGQLYMTIAEAEEHQRLLVQAIADAKEARQGLRPPRQEDGFIDRHSVYEFFGQFLEKDKVRNRAGKLYAALVRSTIPGWWGERPLPMQIICCECGRQITSKPCRLREDHRHYSNEINYKINVNELKEFADQFMEDGSHALSGAKLEDFQLLTSYL